MVVKCRDLSKEFNKVRVVYNVNLDIRSGEIYGLIGENGAGKTTLLKMICGLSVPTQGSIELFDNKNIREELCKLGASIEHPAVYPKLTARENLEAHAILLGRNSSKNITEYLKLVDVEDSEKIVAKYSLGMKQRLMIALALIGNPQLLILDEPMNGLDPLGMKKLREMLLQLNKENNVTIVLSSHMLDELSKISDRYGVMREGHLIKEISADVIECMERDTIIIEADNIKRAVSIINEKLKLSEKQIYYNDHIIEINAPNIADKKNVISISLLENDIRINKLASKEVNIEEHLISLMEGKNE